jgi:NAD(P)-dependent dehydrogenase (short-subunit alcohol dehydrogenase family)
VFVAADIDDRAGEDLVAKIKAAAGEAIYLSLDVTNEARWGEVVADTEARYGRLDILVANAAIMLISPSAENYEAGMPLGADPCDLAQDPEGPGQRAARSQYL